MKKNIYKLLTIENGIILNSDVLNYLSSKIKSEKELEDFFSSFKARFNTASISQEQVEEILENKQERKDFYIEKSYSFKHKDLCTYYEILKKKFPHMVTPISLLVDSVESTIFGIAYRNSMGIFGIEDDYQFVEIDYTGITQDFYLFENMFVGAKGHKSNGTFVVNEFLLTKPTTRKNTYLDDKKPKILIFGETDAISSEIKQIIAQEAPDLSILFSNSDDFQSKDIVVVPCKNEIDELPVLSKIRSNPCLLSLFDGSIGLLCKDLLAYRQHGVFLNQNGLSSMLNSFVSQNSLYPFGSSDFFVEDFPEFFVVAENTHPFVTDVQNIKFISISPFEKSHGYVVLDFKNDKYEIRFRNEE